MAQYKYSAQTADGKKKKGVLAASDESELQLRLKESGLYLLEADCVENNKSRRPFKPKVLSEFSRQLGTLVGAGVTLVRALGILANGESVKPKEREVYEDMLRLIRQGISLSDAMEAQNGAFPSLMIYMYRSAESSGSLDKVAMQMAVHYEKDHKLNAKISSSMVYPKILGFMIVGVILILTKFVLPQFQDLFDQMEELPPTTRILLGFSDLMEHYWILVIAGILGIWVGFRALLRVEKFRRLWDKFKLHIIVFGKLQQTVCTSRFSRTLSSLYTAGIPIVPSLQIARKTVGNSHIDTQFDTVIPYVRAGNNLSEGLDMVDGFSRKLTDSIRVGEETGSLDKMLSSTADSLEYDADMAITKMVSYVEPIMLIVMGVVVAFVMVSVFSALYGSYDSIAGMG